MEAHLNPPTPTAEEQSLWEDMDRAERQADYLIAAVGNLELSPHYDHLVVTRGNATEDGVEFNIEFTVPGLGQPIHGLVEALEDVLRRARDLA